MLLLLFFNSDFESDNTDAILAAAIEASLADYNTSSTSSSIKVRPTEQQKHQQQHNQPHHYNHNQSQQYQDDYRNDQTNVSNNRTSNSNTNKVDTTKIVDTAKMTSSLLIDIIVTANSNQELKNNDIALDIYAAIKCVIFILFFYFLFNHIFLLIFIDLVKLN